jgi:pyoverdine/dityrosine biosynthesis protein Dit1
MGVLSLEVDVKIFEVLARIAEQNNISDTKWSKSSWPKAGGNPQSRIGEIRQIVRIMKGENISQEEASRRIRRKFTIEKMLALYRGLSQILGEDVVSEEILKAIDKEKDPRKRLILTVMLIPDHQLEKVETLLEVFLERKKSQP